jgi:hypothetical protein
VERFRAAVPLVAQIMVLTIATLNFIRFLHQQGVVPVWMASSTPTSL